MRHFFKFGTLAICFLCIPSGQPSEDDFASAERKYARILGDDRPDGFAEFPASVRSRGSASWSFARLATDPWLDEQFMPRAGVKLKVGQQEISAEKTPLPFLVTKINGDWLWVGKAWVQKSQVVPVAAATEYYTKYLQSNPRSSWAYNMRGISRTLGSFDKNAREKALADYTEAIRLDSSNAVAYYNRACLNARYDHLFEGFFDATDEELDKAVHDYSAAIRIDPRYADAYLVRGLIRQHRDRMDPKNEVLNDLNRAIQIGLETGDAVRAHLGRGGILYDKELYDKALADFTEAIRLNPKFEVPYLQRANAWRKKGNLDQAIADYTAVIDMYDDQEDTYLSRGKLWLEKGDPAKAAADFAEALAIDPDYAAYHMKSALDWDKKKEYKMAIDYFTDAIYLDPKFAAAYNSRAWLYATCPEAKHRDGKQAVADAQKACELTAWKNTGYLDTLAAAYAEAGDFQRAIEWINKAIELASNNDEKQTYQKKLELFRRNQPYRGPLK